MSRARIGQGAVVLSLSDLRFALSDPDEGEYSCFICKNAFCQEESCTRAATQTKCCGQEVCCGCMLVLSKRCRCTEDCQAVTASCPFCREVAPVGPLDMFLGSKPPCKGCAEADEREGQEAGTSPQPQPRPPAPAGGSGPAGGPAPDDRPEEPQTPGPADS